MILGILFYLVIPPMFSELSDLASNVPSYLDKPFEIKTINQFLPELPESISQIILGFAESAQGYIGKLTSGFFQATTTLFGGALSFALIIILSFYLSVQEKGIDNFLRIVTPIQHEKYIISLWQRSRNKIRNWFKGQILLGILVGILVYLGLTILRVKYALTFALLAAVFELIPIFGPIMAAIPPIAIAFLQSPSLALSVLILFTIIQQLENHLIYPLVVRKVVGVPPILVIIALIIGGKLAGFFGILLSIPIITVLMEFLSDIEKEKGISA
jgi:predicted PurR-regulated permease PerM